MIPEVKAIIFDFDGVVADTETARFGQLVKQLRERGIDVDSDFRAKTNGRPFKIILEQDFGTTFTPAQIEEILQQYVVEFKDHSERYSQPIRPTVDFIRSYKGPVRLAIASMSIREAINKHLSAFGLEQSFANVATREEVTRYKPEPDIYLKVAENLGLRPENCVAVEDTALGATAAIAAGMRCYAFLNGMNSEKDFVNTPIAGFVSSAADLAAIVKN